MALKVTFFILAALLTVSVSADSLPRENVTLKTISGAFDTLVEFLEEMLVGINMLFSEAIHEVAYGIRSLFGALEELRDVSIAFAEQGVDAEMAILNALIDKYKNGTSEESQIIFQCIEDTENEAVEVQDQAINSSVVCIDSAIQSVGDGMMLILTDIKDLNEALRKEEKTLEDCKNATSPIDCIKDVFSNLADIAAKLVVVIETDADKAQEDFDNVGIVIEQCNNDTAAFLERENERVFNDFSQCVLDRQQSTTPAS